MYLRENPGASVRAWLRLISIVTLLATGLVSCFPIHAIEGLSAKAKYVYGDAKGVTLESDSWFAPDNAADAHCARFGKHAVYAGHQWLSRNSERRLHYYECQEAMRE